MIRDPNRIWRGPTLPARDRDRRPAATRGLPRAAATRPPERELLQVGDEQPRFGDRLELAAVHLEHDEVGQDLAVVVEVDGA
jgi:hypothetical protein